MLGLIFAVFMLKKAVFLSLEDWKILNFPVSPEMYGMYFLKRLRNLHCQYIWKPVSWFVLTGFCMMETLVLLGSMKMKKVKKIPTIVLTFHWEKIFFKKFCSRGWQLRFWNDVFGISEKLSALLALKLFIWWKQVSPVCL